MGITFREEFGNDMKRKVMLIVGIMTILIVMLLCCGTALAQSGNYEGLDWDYTNYVLTLGKEGETQVLADTETRSSSDWPWNRNSIYYNTMSVEIRGNIVLQGSLSYMFYGFQKLESLDLSSNVSLQHVNNMSYMFYGCSVLSSLDLSGLDTTGVTSMNYMFYGCKNLLSLDLSDFNTTSVADMSSMFSNCNNLSVLNVDGFNTENVSSMSYMFNECNALEVLDLSDFNPAQVTNMSYMFNGCSNLRTLDISNFNTLSVTKMPSMFAGCSNLTSLDVSSFDTSNVTDMSSMFKDCAKIEELDVSTFNTSNVTGMGYMFSGCSSMTNLNISGFDTTKVTSVSYMFNNCCKLSYLDISSMTFARASSTYGIYNNCYNLVRFKFGEFNPVQSYYGTLEFPLGRSFMMENSNPQIGPYTASELRTIYVSIDGAGVWVAEDIYRFLYAVYDSQDDTLYILESDERIDTDLDTEQSVVSKSGVEVSGQVYLLNRGRASAGLDDILDSIKHIVCLDEFELLPVASRWFFGFTACEDMDVSKINVSQVRDFSYMFNGCSSLKELDLSAWNPEFLNGADYMFKDCSSLEKLDLQSFKFNISPVTGIFTGCGSLEELDISGYQTTAYNACFDFSGLSSLKRIHLGMYPGNEEFGAPFKWIREDEEYGPWNSATFRTHYGYVLPNSSDSDKAKAGWYVRANDTAVVAVFCSVDDNTLYFIKTSETFKDKSTGVVHRAEDGVAYQGTLYQIPNDEVSMTIQPSWPTYFKHIKVLDAFEPENHSISHWFYQATSLIDADLRLLDVSNVQNMTYAFYGAHATGRIDLTGWQINATSMEYMFYKTYADPLDLTGWDVSNVVRSNSLGLEDMFQGFGGHLIAPDFHWDNYTVSQFPGIFNYAGMDWSGTTVLDVPRWSFGHVDSLTQMFYYAYADVNAQDWNLDGVTRAVNVFRGANKSTKDQKINISGWHSNTLQDANFMFAYSYGTETINVSNWNMPVLENVGGMFLYNEALQSVIGLETWQDVSHISITGSMFESCLKLSYADLSTWKLSGLTKCDGMFRNCKALQSIDLSGFDIQYVENYNYMFGECNALEYLDISGLDASSATSMNSMFYNCYNLNTVVIGGKSPFQGSSSGVYAELPTPPYSQNGHSTSRKWIREDGVYGPLTPSELRLGFQSYYEGTWIWDEKGVNGYTVVFTAPDGTLGSMPPFRVPDSNYSYYLPRNKFVRPGAKFVRWRDNIKNYTYGDANSIYGYAPGSVVVLTAEFDSDGGGAIVMDDGSFTFNLKKNQMAVFDNIPVNTVYQVYEETPSGWQLIAQSDDSGVIEAETRSEAGFTNRAINEQCSLIISGSKFFDTDLAEAGQFQFELLDEEGNIVSTAVNGAGGNIVFDALTFTADDVGKDLYYTVRETLPSSDATMYTSLDADHMYDAHEERIRVVVSYRIKDGGAVYSSTNNFDGKGNRLKSILQVEEPVVEYAHSSNLSDSGHKYDFSSGPMKTVYSHTDNVADDGSKIGDIESGKYYADVITIPNATKLNVKVKYSNVRGTFWIWRGAFDGVYTQTYTSEYNTSNYYRSYTYKYDRDDELLTDEFVISGDSLTVLYTSSIVSSTDNYYTEGISNYGYYMEVTAIDDGSSDYVSNKTYSSIVRVPGATKLHLKVQYSNPRDGLFALWSGSHAEVGSRSWSEDCNPTNALYTFEGENTSELLTREFDINGDSFSAVYYSRALDPSDDDYTLYSNYGYHITVSAVEMSNFNSVRQDGSLISDYMSNQLYTDVVKIPGAESLHVELTYSTPRGYFYVWEGEYPNPTVYSADHTPNTAVKSYQYSSNNEGQLLTDSFDVQGNSLSVAYYSYAFPLDSTQYNNLSNYGYCMKVTPINMSSNGSNYVEYSSTPNVGEDGSQNGAYTSGKDYVDIVSIPGARGLGITVMFNMGSNDRLRIFAGNHPEYTYDTSASSVAWLTGSTSYTYNYSVGGDTLTFVFHADANSTGGTGYGYYATIRPSPGIGELYAEAIYDDDGVLFENKSGSGYLTLAKLASTEYKPDGQFMYEISFVDDKGEMYDMTSEGVSYYRDDDILPNNLVTVYHVGRNYNGTEYGVLYTEKYPMLQKGDFFLLKSKSIDGFVYSDNDYSGDDMDDIQCVVGDNPIVVHMYYDILPYQIKVQHALVNTSGQRTSIKETETIAWYAQEEIVISPKHYDGYEYISNDFGLIPDADLHGVVMPDKNIMITLNYMPVRQIEFAHRNGLEDRAYRIELDSNYTGLRTGTLGNIEFVDGVANILLTSEATELKKLLVPYGTRFAFTPVDEGRIAHVRFSYGNIHSASQGHDLLTFNYIANTSGNCIIEFFGDDPKTLTVKRMKLGANGTATQLLSDLTYKLYNGDPIGLTWYVLGSSDIYYNGTTYYYSHQDLDPNIRIQDEDVTLQLFFGTATKVTVQHITVSANGSETVRTTRNHTFGAYGHFSIDLLTYNGYHFDNAVCTTDSSIEINGNGPITGVLNGSAVTIQIRYKAN